MKRTYECYMCMKQFSTRSYLKFHIQIAHVEAKSRHRCEVCHREFKALGHFKRHKRIHSNDFPFDCPHCDKKFRFNQKLKVCSVVFEFLSKYRIYDILHMFLHSRLIYERTRVKNHSNVYFAPIVAVITPICANTCDKNTVIFSKDYIILVNFRIIDNLKLFVEYCRYFTD